LDKNCRATEE